MKNASIRVIGAALVLLASAISSQSQGFGGTGNVINGQCSGDLTGAYPACIVAKINGNTPAAVATSGSAADLAAGVLPAGRLSGAYGSITGVGTLTSGATGAGFTIAPVANNYFAGGVYEAQ